MNILVVGLNHNTAIVEVREKLAFEGDRLLTGLKALVSLPEVKEAVVLSTCNRVEMYTNVADTALASEAVKKFISEFHGIDKALLDDALYFYNGDRAVSHVFRVASSLDSMVVGEPQILGQLKDAFELALSEKTTGVLLNKLMKKAISVAKRVRTETAIAENAVSISFAAVELAKKIFSDIEKKTVMLLGAGEMAELAAKHLISCGVRDIIVANRTHSRALALAGEMQGRAVPFQDFPDELVHTDIVICSTGAPEYVLGKDQMHHVMKERKQKPVFIIDISVPLNIDPGAGHLENVFLYNVDDLKDVVDTNRAERQKEADSAERIVEDEVEIFLKWRASLDAVPAIIALRTKAEQIKNEELEKVFNRLPDLGDKERKAVEQLANTLINKLIHPPTAALKEDAEDKDVLIATLKKLYGLE